MQATTTTETPPLPSPPPRQFSSRTGNCLNRERCVTTARAAAKETENYVVSHTKYRLTVILLAVEVRNFTLCYARGSMISSSQRQRLNLQWYSTVQYNSKLTIDMIKRHALQSQFYAQHFAALFHYNCLLLNIFPYFSHSVPVHVRFLLIH